VRATRTPIFFAGLIRNTQLQILIGLIEYRHTPNRMWGGMCET